MAVRSLPRAAFTPSGIWAAVPIRPMLVITQSPHVTSILLVQGIFVAEDVKSDAWSEEVVLRVSEDIVPVFKDADRIDGRIGRHVLDEGGDTCRTGSHPQVVLDILIGIDICERNRIFGLKRLQQIDDVLFTAGRHGSSGTISLSLL